MHSKLEIRSCCLYIFQINSFSECSVYIRINSVLKGWRYKSRDPVQELACPLLPLGCRPGCPHVVDRWLWLLYCDFYYCILLLATTSTNTITPTTTISTTTTTIPPSCSSEHNYSIWPLRCGPSGYSAPITPHTTRLFSRNLSFLTLTLV